EAIGPLARGLAAGRAALAESPADEVVEKVRAAGPSCSVTAARWSGPRLFLSAARAPLPFLLRAGQSVRVSAAGEGSRLSAVSDTLEGDLLVLASSGLERLQTGDKTPTPQRLVEELAGYSTRESLERAFERAVSGWKAAGFCPGPADVVLL